MAVEEGGGGVSGGGEEEEGTVGYCLGEGGGT